MGDRGAGEFVNCFLHGSRVARMVAVLLKQLPVDAAIPKPAYLTVDFGIVESLEDVEAKSVVHALIRCLGGLQAAVRLMVPAIEARMKLGETE